MLYIYILYKQSSVNPGVLVVSTCIYWGAGLNIGVLVVSRPILEYTLTIVTQYHIFELTVVAE